MHARSATVASNRRCQALELGFKKHVPIGFRLLVVPDGQHDNLKEVVEGVSLHAHLQCNSVSNLI